MLHFITIDGSLLDCRDISKIALVVSGKRIDSDDINAIRAFANTCNGINGEKNIVGWDD